MKLSLTLALVSLTLLGIGIGYLFTQQPRFYFSLERTGFALLKGRYRSYLWRWCDGYTHQITNRDGATALVPVISNRNGGLCLGHYWIPRFTHFDAKDLPR